MWEHVLNTYPGLIAIAISLGVVGAFAFTYRLGVEVGRNQR